MQCTHPVGLLKCVPIHASPMASGTFDLFNLDEKWVSSTSGPGSPRWSRRVRQIGRTCCADLDRTLERGANRLSRAVTAVAWIHLSCFLACQVLYDPSVQRDPRLVFIWAGELAAVVAVLRVLVGASWFGSSSSLSVVTRLWATFLILSFNLVMLNALNWLGIPLVQAGVGDPEQFLLRSAGVALHPAVLHPGRPDVLYSPPDGSLQGLREPDLRRVLVARPSGHRLGNPAAGAEREGLTLVAERCFVRACPSKARDGSRN